MASGRSVGGRRARDGLATRLGEREALAGKRAARCLGSQEFEERHRLQTVGGIDHDRGGDVLRRRDDAIHGRLGRRQVENVALEGDIY